MKFLCVCLGNICRSPLAEAILQSKLPENYIVDSAGLISMHEGEKPDKRAIKIAENHHLDISKQKSRPITSSDFENFEAIFCMDTKVYQEVLSKAKTADYQKKVILFLEAAENKENVDVPDPYWGDLQDFEEVYQLINESSNVIVDKILNQKLIS